MSLSFTFSMVAFSIASSRITLGLNQYPIFLNSGIVMSIPFSLQNCFRYCGAESPHPFLPEMSKPNSFAIKLSTASKYALFLYIASTMRFLTAAASFFNLLQSRGVYLTLVNNKANGLISLPATVGIPLIIPSTTTVPEPENGSNNAFTGCIPLTRLIIFLLIGHTITAG